MRLFIANFFLIIKMAATKNLVTFYLFVYNLLQWGAWLYVLTTQMGMAYAAGGDTSPAKLWQAVGKVGWWACNAAILELIHALAGFVSSSPMTVFLQLCARLPVVHLVYFIPELQNQWGIHQALLAYGCVETTRYLFYAWSLYAEPPYALTWLRYSIFLCDYPLGLMGEMWVWYGASRVVRGDLVYACYMLLACYPPGMVWLYLQVLRLRRKKPGSSVKKAKGKS